MIDERLGVVVWPGLGSAYWANRRARWRSDNEGTEPMSWTQPLCISCWNRNNPDQPTQGLGDIGVLERCCECGVDTRSGLYIRIDPSTVAFPSEA